MLENALDQWERGFRAAAEADGFAVFREHLERLGLPKDPQLMLEGTVCLVRMVAVYAQLDGNSTGFEEFLKMQTYNPADASNAEYSFTFDLCGKAFARVLVDAELHTLDLADLYGSPWMDFEVVGFQHLWISHLDWSNLTDEKRHHLEEEVTDDLRFDYSESELDMWFDDSLDKAYLFVTVQDVYETED
jgi:hypothetical protein